MQHKAQVQAQTFNDGVVKIYSVGNQAVNGNMPKKGLSLKGSPLRYEERTVGISRFWVASREGTKVERLLRLPRVNTVCREDIAIPNDGNQYRIIQVQYPKGVTPPSMDLSLERVDKKYDIVTS